MDKIKAYDVLGVNDNASDDEITEVYFKHLKNISSGFNPVDKETNEPITKEILDEAYHKVMDREKVVVNSTKKEKSEDFIRYYGVKIIVAIVVLAIVGGTIIYKVTQPKYDLTIRYIGTNFTVADAKLMQNAIKAKLPELKNVSVMDIDISDDTEGYLLQRNLTQISVGDIDVVVFDNASFQQYAKQGVLQNLDTLTKQQGIYVPGSSKCLVQAEGDTSPVFYGIDESRNNLLSISNDPKAPDNRTKIVVVSASPKNAENVNKFLKMITK